MLRIGKTHPAWGLVSLVMWVTYGRLTGAGDWLYAGAAGLVLSSIMIVADYRRGAIKVMNATSVGYFLLEMMIVTGIGRTFMQRYHLPIVWGVFAVVAWITLAGGSPFTEQYTRERIAPEWWEGPTFYRMNAHLTIMWSLIFTLGTVLGAITIAVGHVALLGNLIPYVAMILGLIIGSRYPKRFAAKFETESRLQDNQSETVREAARP